MSSQFQAANTGFLDTHPSSTPADIQMTRIPLVIKVTIMIFLSLILPIFSVLAITRTGLISKISPLPDAYLPYNSLPLLPKGNKCLEAQHLNRSCVIHDLDQTIYITYDLATRMIVRSAFQADEYQIGDLIVAWGDPTGVTQYTGFVLVSWGTRSALLYTHSFRPESQVELIQYDLRDQAVHTWQGFNTSKSVEKVD